MNVELIYEKSCPNIAAARTQLVKALGAVKQKISWTEWESSDPELPEHAQGYGSPTILVNGKDVTATDVNETKSDADCCRIYLNGDANNKGIPSLDQITSAFSTNNAVKKPSRISGVLSFIPAVFLAALPKLTCPYCWPAYAGFLSSMGLGFIDYTPYILPFTVVFLVIALFTLFYKAPQRRGYRPFLVGVTGAIILVTGKIIYDNDVAMYSALVLLIGASLWNSWPQKQTDKPACPACVS